jgi:uncharacterized protein
MIEETVDSISQDTQKLDVSNLFLVVAQGFELNLKGIHGMYHWARVLENGLKLSEVNGEDKRIIILFSLYHDSKRKSDGFDPQHGRRGALFAQQFRNHLFKIEDRAFQKLTYACEYHSDELMDEDVTIQTCWDADRLDLGRVGIMPKKKLLGRLVSDHIEIFEWSTERGFSYFINETARMWETLQKT